MSNTPVRELDFDQIKRSLRDYLRGQDQFKDYDFEGSTMNILLDLLAYNTHYQAFYANMVANEAFLDSAVARNSVVSLAKHLGYNPRSKKAARAIVNIELVPDASGRTQPAYTTVLAGREYIPSGTTFTTRNDRGKSVPFVTLEDYRFRVSGNRFIAENVALYEGSLKTTSFVVNTKDTLQKFIIDDTSIDIDTLSLRVQRSVTDSEGIQDIWTRTTDITKLNGDSTSFFVQESENGKWEVYFGDGIIGRAVENGNLITMIYLSTNGPEGNGLGSRDSAASPAFTVGNTEWRVRVVVDDRGSPEPSFGGTDPETLKSIKYYAPRNYQAQERAVTADDYLTILAREYSLRSESFLVWGGEENDPPQYGKVFISVKPKNAARLTTPEKQAIARTILGDRNLITVIPEVVDADITYINPSITVYYNPQATNVTAEVLATGVRNKALEYSETNLDQFGKNFRLSKFNTFIDGLDASFNSNRIEIKLEKRLEPQFGRSLPYTIKFDNELLHPIEGYLPILESSEFLYPDLSSSLVSKPTVVAFFDDDGYGNLRIYKKVGEERIYLAKKVGTINYKTGLVDIKSFSPIGIPNGLIEINVRVRPNRGDVFVRRNQVLAINQNEVGVEMVQEKTIIERKATDASFPFST